MPFKSEVDQLALFGAAPAFERQLHVGRPNLGDRVRFFQRLDDILDRRWLTNDGPYVREFEQRIAEIAGAAHAVAVSNGETGLEIAIRAVGLSGEVIVPSLTFVATAHALQWLGLKPVFCDVDPETHNLAPERVEQLITPRTTGILAVHLWGRPSAVDQLTDISARHNLALLFDAAHAFGCSFQGRSIGGFGRAEIFSFHATKFINAFEGGAIATNDADLAHRLRLMRNFGFSGYDRVDDLGINGKMSEVSAAAGLTNLESMPRFIADNRRNYECYRAELKDVPGLSLLSFDEAERCNYQYVVGEVASDCPIPRNLLIEVLWSENVLARRYFYPGCHRLEPYRTLDPGAAGRLRNTAAILERILQLPTGSTIEPEDIRTVCSILRTAILHGPEISRRMAGRPLRFVSD